MNARSCPRHDTTFSATGFRFTGLAESIASRLDISDRVFTRTFIQVQNCRRSDPPRISHHIKTTSASPLRSSLCRKSECIGHSLSADYKNVATAERGPHVLNPAADIDIVAAILSVSDLR